MVAAPPSLARRWPRAPRRTWPARNSRAATKRRRLQRPPIPRLQGKGGFYAPPRIVSPLPRTGRGIGVRVNLPSSLLGEGRGGGRKDSARFFVLGGRRAARFAPDVAARPEEQGEQDQHDDREADVAQDRDILRDADREQEHGEEEDEEAGALDAIQDLAYHRALLAWHWRSVGAAGQPTTCRTASSAQSDRCATRHARIMDDVAGQALTATP